MIGKNWYNSQYTFQLTISVIWLQGKTKKAWKHGLSNYAFLTDLNKS